MPGHPLQTASIRRLIPDLLSLREYTNGANHQLQLWRGCLWAVGIWADLLSHYCLVIMCRVSAATISTIVDDLIDTMRSGYGLVNNERTCYTYWFVDIELLSVR